MVGQGASHPRWSPDGKQLYLLRNEKSELDLTRDNVWLVSLPGGQERPVTDLRGRRGWIGRFTLAVDDRFVYFTWE